MNFEEIKAAVMNLDEGEHRLVVLELLPAIWPILGVGFNFFSQVNLEALAAAGQTAVPEVCGKTLTLQALTSPAARFGERAVGGESLIWNFWWIIPLLWNEWFFHKRPFYAASEH